MALSNFGKAFREARAAGDKTFTFNGKKYTTEMAPDAQKSVGGKPKLGEYKPRDSDARKGENATSKNTVSRDSYVRSGQKSFDTETEAVPPDMSSYKPRRDPGASGAVGGDYMSESANSRRVRNMYERGAEETGMKKGGVTRADGCVTKGHTKGRMV
jgi:hypothetical protein